MKVKLMSWEYSPGVSVYIVPETDAERELLRAVWKHGKMETTNGVADSSGIGFCVSMKSEPSPDGPKGGDAE